MDEKSRPVSLQSASLARDHSPAATYGSVRTPKPDRQDLFSKCCRDSMSYPESLLKRQLWRDEIHRYQDYLRIHDDGLFRTDKAQLLLWELWIGDHKYRETIVSKPKPLKEHLDRHHKDPQIRFVFIESDHSRAALNCSSDILKYVLTYHQVDPTFLDYIFSFGDCEEPSDACLSHFQYDDALFGGTQLPPLEMLGRSGEEVRFSVLLRAPERSEAGGWPWSIRQAALYHSFDVANGRSFWICIKGNDLLQRRITDETGDLSSPFSPRVPGVAENDVAPSLGVNLNILLLCFKWCEGEWRWFIRDMEDAIRNILIRAKTAPIDKEPHFANLPKEASRSNSGLSMSKAIGRLETKFTIASTFSDISDRGKAMLSPTRWQQRRRRTLTTELESALKQEPKEQGSRQAPKPNVPEPLVLEMFKYQDLQDLNILGEKVEEAILIVKLNRNVLQDVLDYYQMLVEYDSASDIRGPVIQFSRKVKAIMRSLEIREEQLRSLYTRLEEGKTLFENLLQYRSLQVSRIFAEHGYKSTKTMENIARKTSQETLSMHTITILTLTFLPGTFVAAFFQSGILDFDAQGDDGRRHAWLFHNDAFVLFIAIVIPLTVVVFSVWLAIFWSGSRRRHSQLPISRKQGTT